MPSKAQNEKLKVREYPQMDEHRNGVLLYPALWFEVTLMVLCMGWTTHNHKEQL